MAQVVVGMKDTAIIVERVVADIDEIVRGASPATPEPPTPELAGSR